MPKTVSVEHQLPSQEWGLDKIVASRTHDLEAANAQLRKEIEDRQQAEKELRLSEKRFEKAFQVSPIPMAIQSLTTSRPLIEKALSAADLDCLVVPGGVYGTSGLFLAEDSGLLDIIADKAACGVRLVSDESVLWVREGESRGEEQAE